MEQKTIRIGMIGAGGIARERHLPNLAGLPGVRLVAVANRTRKSGEAAAAEYGFSAVYDDWRELAAAPDIDAVFICTQPYMHREMTLYALEQGKHVFCQARMAMNLDDARQMLEADKRTALTTMLCPAPHYMQAAPFVRDWLEAGRLGEIRHIVLTHPGTMLLDPQKPLFWRQRSALQGINMLDVGIAAEVLNSWFGPAARLSALAKTWVAERPADLDGSTKVELPDSVTVIGELQSGALLTAVYSSSVQGGVQQLTIHGERGSLTCYPYEAYVLVRDASGERRIELGERQGGWRAEREFVEAIREGRKGTPSFQDGIRYMAFTQAVADSIVQGKTIELSDG